MRKVLIAVAVAALAAGTVACEKPSTPAKPGPSSEAITTPPTTSKSAATTTASSTPAASSACADLGGTVGAANLCTVHAEKPGYTIDMSFPVDYPDQASVKNVLTKQRDQFVAAVEEPPVREVPKALDVKSTTYRSGTPDAGTESLAFEEYVNVGGAHPVTNYNALNYDLSKKAPITFDTLFKSGTDPVAVLDPIVRKQLMSQLEGLSINENSIGADMYKNFALTDDAVIFFIDQGEWTIEAAGPQLVSVPRSKLASILA